MAGEIARSPSAPHFGSLVVLFRAIVCGFIAAAYVCSDNLTEVIRYLYEKYLFENVLFKHDSFEPCFAVTLFALNIGAWWLLDNISPTFYRALKPYRIDTSNDLSSWDDDKRISNETLWYILPLLVFDYIYPRRVLDPTPPSFPTLIVEVALCLILFDIFFFLGHFALHSIPSLPLSRIHTRHHSMKVIRAGDAIRHSFFDGSFDVLCSIAALNTVHAHPLSRSIYNICAIYFITEAHCGYNFPYMLHNIFPSVFAGPERHLIHHKKGTHNYQKFTLILS